MEQYLKRLLNLVALQGLYTIVKSGLVNGDEIVVDGLTKVKKWCKGTSQLNCLKHKLKQLNNRR